MKIYLAILLFFSFVVSLDAEARVRPAEWAQPMIGSSLDNFYQVSPDVYRSSQPDKDDMKTLKKMGIKSVLNLRSYFTDDDEAKGTNLKLYRIEMSAGNIEKEKLKEALDIIRKAEKPILIHCKHGSDRTGVVIALYRMVLLNWSREKAIDEFVNGGFGYHEMIYPYLKELLRDIRLEQFKQ
jgi:protein tyrosine/serine phosphatase